MSQTIEDLRAALFATITALRDPAAPLDIARAKAVVDVAQTIINSAKVDVDMINALGSKHAKATGFIAAASREIAPPAASQPAPWPTAPTLRMATGGAVPANDGERVPGPVSGPLASL